MLRSKAFQFKVKYFLRVYSFFKYTHTHLRVNGRKMVQIHNTEKERKNKIKDKRSVYLKGGNREERSGQEVKLS